MAEHVYVKLTFASGSVGCVKPLIHNYVEWVPNVLKPIPHTICWRIIQISHV